VGGMNVTITAVTSNEDFAGTATGATIAFKIGDNYTEEVPLVEHAAAGSSVTWHARLSSWPSMVRITGTNDSWSVDRIELQGGDTNATLFNGSSGSSKISATGSLKLTVPTLHSGKCVTRYDPRIEAMVAATAESGTPCIFGLDDRDEGAHCVYDNGLFGSYGWCYTDEAASTWGSCSEGCPLQGSANVLGKKLDKVMDKIDEAGKNFDTIIGLVNPTDAPAEEEEAPPHAAGGKGRQGATSDSNATSDANATSDSNATSDGKNASEH
jgi:hypothetical protein